MITVVGLFVNKLTTPRILSANELLANGLYLFESPKQISNFSFYSTNNIEFTKSFLVCSSFFCKDLYDYRSLFTFPEKNSLSVT